MTYAPARHRRRDSGSSLRAPQDFRPRPAPLAPAVLVGSGLAGTALSWFVAQHSLVGARWKFFLPVVVWLVVWAAGAAAARRIPSRRSAVLIVLVAAAAMRVAAATGTTPSISNDLYRYGWDAHVQASGIDPYRYPPAAPQLQSLRVPPFFPTGPGCAHIGKPPGCTTLNRSADRTIYPPVAQLWFDLVAAVAPGRDVREWQLAAAAVDLAVVGLLMVALRRLGRDPTQAAWYALSPIPVIEFAGNGHVDGLALLLLVAALLALQRGRRAMAGLLIGLAAMVKLYPGVAVIACWRRGRWRMAVTAAAVGVVSYLPHVLVVGTRVVGYLPGYLKEEHYGSGSRFLLLGVLPLPSRAVTAVGVLFFAAVAVMVLRRGLEPAAGLAVVLTAAIVIACPVQPWYAVVLGGIGVLVGAPWLIGPALLGEIYYAAVILDHSHQVAIGRACFGAALAVIIAAQVLARRRAVGPSGPTISRRRACAGSASPARGRTWPT